MLRKALLINGIALLILAVVAILLINKGVTRPSDTYGMDENSFALQSDFENGYIASEYTCDGDGTPPPLRVTGVPRDAHSLVLIVEDPDVPKALKPDGRFLHWLLFNIPADAQSIGPTGSIATNGTNSLGKEGYVPPCPPREYEPSTHRYVFHLYALDSFLSLEDGASESDVRQAMAGHVLAETELMGTYRRQ